jgi:universal stress protein A
VRNAGPKFPAPPIGIVAIAMIGGSAIGRDLGSSDGMPTRFRRILVPHDFSPTATHALRVAADLAERHGGRITALHVLTPFYSGPGYPTQEEIAWTPPAEIARERERRLGELVREALGPRARLVTCRAVLGEAVPAIVDAAAKADVIVMTTLGRSGLAHLLIGSVAEKVVRHAPIPVLTVRAPTAPARGGRRRGAARRGAR